MEYYRQHTALSHPQQKVHHGRAATENQSNEPQGFRENHPPQKKTCKWPQGSSQKETTIGTLSPAPPGRTFLFTRPGIFSGKIYNSNCSDLLQPARCAMAATEKTVRDEIEKQGKLYEKAIEKLSPAKTMALVQEIGKTIRNFLENNQKKPRRKDATDCSLDSFDKDLENALKERGRWFAKRRRK